MALNKQTKETAFQLYCSGLSNVKIAKFVGVKSDATIGKWAKLHNWVERREKANIYINKFGRNKDEELNKELLKSIKAVWGRLVKSGLAKVNARDVIEVIKIERLLLGESTENIAVKSGIWTEKELFDKYIKEKKPDDSDDES